MRGVMASAPAVAQDNEDAAERESKAQKTKQAQAVSKEFYDRIQKAQEEIDADNQQEALDILERLKTRKGITEYELQQVLNYIGFVKYNLDDIAGAMAAYEEMIAIPSPRYSAIKNASPRPSCLPK